MRLQVLQVITDPARRGAQLFAVDLSDALRRAGLDVRTVALGPAQDGVTVDVPVLGPGRVSWSTVAVLRREIARADVAVAHGGQTLPTCALATAGRRQPFVYRQISDSLFWASTASRRLRVRAGLARAKRVVALWEGAASTLESHFGVRSDRVVVIPNGVAEARFNPVGAERRAQERRAHSLDERRFTLVYSGALVREKGVDAAIEAVARCPSTQLLVAGAGPEGASLRALAERIAPGRVTFVGTVDDSRSVYAAGDVVVLASRGGDSMPAMLIEAGLMQLPAIATPVEAIPEIVLPGTTGELVPIDDTDALTRAIDALAAQPDRTAALGLAARAHCLERFSIGPVATAWAAVLRDAVR